jgi:nucleotide-binding universal stress UspA family protein
MKIVKILLPISQHGTTAACAEAAFGLAQRFGAWLEVLHACPTPADRLPYATELSPVYFDQLIDVGTKQVSLEKRQAKKWFDKTAKVFPKVGRELLTIEGPIPRTVSMRSKVADLTILPGAAGKDETDWAVMRDAALLHSGRPLLLVPEVSERAIGETVLIAWKDTVEAVRAVAAAQPFLTGANKVQLLSVTKNPNDDQTAPAMADYLSRAGASVKLERIYSNSQVGPVLLEAAIDANALLVMGAYGHWRLREWVFGGATEYVLRNTSVPLFLMH